ncbi:hypothetical protein P43SY_006027 [Pythium insidiosum]|uniref:RWD domain-containing protein n=1 Tax=Pythium insidiosum TaxID=114742 RepID=A0AAD5LAS5_PYTIN|nr:hypothetical protein P43SY_006027 [Pythium insidiosum]
MEQSNVELQNEEIEVLQSIFEDDVQLHGDYDDPGSSRSLGISIPGPHSIQLTVHLPSTYPSDDAPVAIISESFGLTNAQRDAILGDLRANGQVCLYEWIENVREKYATSEYDPASDLASLELNDKDDDQYDGDGDAGALAFDPEAFRNDALTLRPRVRGAQLLRDAAREQRLRPLIFHGATITDRKSTFQGHACPVTCVEDVRAFLALLLDDRKIARAIHNMLAYRIVGDFVVKDNDEDGEDGAGSKLSHLLELTRAANVAVVVTRWFGGVLLGPDRFKHINAAARQALEDGGFLAASESANHKRPRGPRKQ